MWTESYDEVTIMKTEVKEELYDFESIFDEADPLVIQKTDTSKSFPPPENDIKPIPRLIIEDADSKNGLRKEGNGYKCDGCRLVFVETSHLKEHYRKCCFKKEELLEELDNDGARFICNFCKEEFVDKTAFFGHIKQCERYYSRLPVHKMDLKSHILKHSDAEKNLKCEDYKYSTDVKQRLTIPEHVHTNDRPFKCGSCEYAAAHNCDLKKHFLLKHSDKEKKYHCTDCDYSSHMKHTLIMHTRVHTNEKPFKCDACDYAAANRSNLNKHVLLKHSDEDKRYKCNECAYSAHVKQYLISHMRVHTNEKPFKCDDCDYAAVTKSNLNKHILLRHSDKDKRFVCGNCDYSARIKQYLISHMRIHAI